MLLEDDKPFIFVFFGRANTDSRLSTVETRHGATPSFSYLHSLFFFFFLVVVFFFIVPKTLQGHIRGSSGPRPSVHTLLLSWVSGTRRRINNVIGTSDERREGGRGLLSGIMCPGAG